MNGPTKRLRELAKLLGPISKCTQNEMKGSQKEIKGEIMGCGSLIPTKISIKEKMKVFIE